MASKTRRFCFLTAKQIMRLNSFAKLSTNLTQPSMLESAVQSPMNTEYYAGERNLFQLAAKLSEKIIMNHAFSDGNKRTAMVAADMFLKMNGHQLQEISLEKDSVNGRLAQAHAAVCTGHCTFEQLGQLYEEISTEVGELASRILSYKLRAIIYSILGSRPSCII